MSIEAIKTTNWRRHFIGIILLSIGFTILNNLDNSHEPANLLRSFIYTFMVCASMWLGNGFINDWLSRHISWVQKPGLRLTIGVLMMVLYTVVIYLIIIESIEWYNGKEFSSRMYWQSMLITMTITALISLILHARSFLSNWRQSAIDRERLEKAHVASQYESLRNQVNPHFLFNSLNVLTELVHQDPDLSEKFIRQLSRVYRYVLEKREVEVVPLEEELSFLKSFLFLQEIRQPNTLQIEWPEGVGAECCVPPLALQLLAENAIKHNILDVDRPLKLSLWIEDEKLVVQNVLQPRLHPTEGTGVGLSNLINRYKYLTARKVEVEKTATHFRVSLPLLKLPA